VGAWDKLPWVAVSQDQGGLTAGIRSCGSHNWTARPGRMVCFERGWWIRGKFCS